MKTFVFTGGGTGGHIYPGLAVAIALQKISPCRIIWLGSKGNLDREIVEKAGLEFYAIPSGKLRRYFSLKNIGDVFRIIAGFFVARSFLKKIKPVALFSKGGFVSVPPCVAAHTLGIPVLGHDSDFSPGLATKLNSRFSRFLFVAYQETAEALKKRSGQEIIVSGNPVRPIFYSGNEKEGRKFLGFPSDRPILLVLGGSQGAQQINELIAKILPELLKDWAIVHQTGNAAKGIPSAQPGYLPLSYIYDELPHVLAASSLVLCRSGAGNLWESAAVGKPMLLIPLAASSRGDQVENAQWFVARGAAQSLVGPEATAPALLAALQNLAGDGAKRQAMAQASKALGKGNASELIAEKLQSYVSME